MLDESFQCPRCQKNYSTRSSLNRHIRNTKCGKSQGKKFACECGAQFNEKLTLSRHSKTCRTRTIIIDLQTQNAELQSRCANLETIVDEKSSIITELLSRPTNTTINNSINNGTINNHHTLNMYRDFVRDNFIPICEENLRKYAEENLKPWDLYSGRTIGSFLVNYLRSDQLMITDISRQIGLLVEENSSGDGSTLITDIRLRFLESKTKNALHKIALRKYGAHGRMFGFLDPKIKEMGDVVKWLGDESCEEDDRTIGSAFRSRIIEAFDRSKLDIFESKEERDEREQQKREQYQLESAEKSETYEKMVEEEREIERQRRENQRLTLQYKRKVFAFHKGDGIWLSNFYKLEREVNDYKDF